MVKSMQILQKPPNPETETLLVPSSADRGNNLYHNGGRKVQVIVGVSKSTPHAAAWALSFKSLGCDSAGPSVITVIPVWCRTVMRGG